jgi:hypothetical protein
VVHDPVAEDGEAAPDPLGVGRLDVVPAGEVERDPVVGGGGPVRRTSQAAMLSTSRTSPWARVKGSGHSRTGTNSTSASWSPASSARRQW